MANFDVVALLKGVTQQLSPTITGAGTSRELRTSVAGQLFTEGWKEELIQAGLAYTCHVGSLSAGADLGFITGGGNGTTVDSDQPEFIISVPTGYALIPLSVQVTTRPVIVTSTHFAHIAVFADLAKAWDATGTATTPTVTNLMAGSSTTTVCTARTAFTADTTDPVMTQLLAHTGLSTVDAGTAGSASIEKLELNYEPSYPIYLRGPAMLVGVWGGSAALPGIATIQWAEVPTSRIPVS